MNDRHLTVAELAQRLGLPLKSIYGMNSSGSGPRYMHIGKYARYRIEDVVEWEKSRLRGGERSA